MRFDAKNLAEFRLIEIYSVVRFADKREEIEREWLGRYAIPFPYKLDIRGDIFNVVSQKVIDDNLAPEEVFLAAERLRKRRANEW